MIFIQLFKDINDYPKDGYYNLSKKTEKLFTFQCEETVAIKPKI